MRLGKKNLLSNFILFDPRSLTKLRNECDYWKAKAEGEHLAFVAVQEEIDKIQETFTDENGTVWETPTSYAYAAACNALHKHTDQERFLRQALEFYANKDNHEQYYIGNGEPDILEDAGKIARVALGQEVVK